MGLRKLTACLLLGLAIPFVQSSDLDLSDSEIISDISRSPSPKATVKYFSPRRANIQPSPVELIRSNSNEPLFHENQRPRVYDPQIFLPLGMDNLRNVPSTSNTSIGSPDGGLTALENALKPDNEAVELTSGDRNILAKSVASFFLAIILLLFYNGVFLHLFH